MIGLLVEQDAEAANGVGDVFRVRIASCPQPYFVRILRTCLQEQFFDVADDHGSIFRIPGGKEVERPDNRRFHGNGLSGDSGGNSKPERIAHFQSSLNEQIVGGTNTPVGLVANSFIKTPSCSEAKSRCQ